MSFSLISNCGYCENNKTCTDSKRISEAIQKIHTEDIQEGTHMGSGSVVLSCFKCKYMSKIKYGALAEID